MAAVDQSIIDRLVHDEDALTDWEVLDLFAATADRHVLRYVREDPFTAIAAFQIAGHWVAGVCRDRGSHAAVCRTESEARGIVQVLVSHLTRASGMTGWSVTEQGETVGW